MASKEELYVSISPEIYKKGKYAILKSKSDIILALKYIRNLRVLARQKRDLKLNLNKLVSSTLSEIKALQEKLPDNKLPKGITKKKKKEVKQERPKKEKKKEKEKIKDSLDEELKSIQEKLMSLNSY